MSEYAENLALARWWQRWFEEDYSWDGLRNKQISGSGATNGATTLQEYWRRDPTNPNIVRTDEVLRANEELLTDSTGKLWHIVHFPERLLDGTRTWKSDPKDARWVALNSIIGARLEAGNGKRLIVRRGQSTGREGRSLLTGAIAQHLPSESGEDGALHISAKQAAFLAVTSVEDTSLGRRAEFQDALFASDFTLQDLEARDANFSNALFLAEVIFLSCTVNVLNMTAAVITGEAWFGRCKFLSAATFSSVEFKAEAQFPGASFLSAVSFEDVIFSRDADFSEANFAGPAHFERAIFRNQANFEGAAATDQSSAIEQIVELDVSAENGVASKLEGFIKTPVADNALKRRSFRQVSFSAAKFEGDADFSNRSFLAATDFSHAKFLRLALFHDSKLHQDISFAGASFALPSAPASEKPLSTSSSLATAQDGATKLTPQVLNQHFERYERAFRTLKLAMEGHRARREEARFFRKELEARRRRPVIKSETADPKEVTFAEKIVSKLYEVTSDFGESLLLPLLWLIGLWCFFSFAYASLANELSFECWLWQADCKISQAVTLASERTWLPFLATGTSLADWWQLGTSGNDLLASAAGILHRVCATLLIFLFALAAKRKYQIS